MAYYDAQGNFFSSAQKPEGLSLKEPFGILNDGLRVCPPHYTEAYPEGNFKEYTKMNCCPELTVYDVKQDKCVGEVYNTLSQ